MTTEINLRVVAEVANGLGEGPVWHAIEGALYWVDILADRVYRYDPAIDRVDFSVAPPFPSAVMPGISGDLLLAVKGEAGLFSFEEGVFRTQYAIERANKSMRCNDGKRAPDGRFWVGTMALDGTSGAGSLYLLEAPGRITRLIENVTISNGMAWDTNKGLFYYIDTPTRRVVAYDYDINRGTIHGGVRPVVTVDERDGWPDGMTIDAEGNLWVALWDGWAVVCFDPDTGERLAEIRLPVARPTSCVFGGEGLDTLYITSAKKGLDADDLALQPLAGALFGVDGLGIKGIIDNCDNN